MDGLLCLGRHAMKGTPITVSEEDRARSMHVVGRPGSGKSKLLEAMIRTDIEAGRGLLLLDPHGDLYHDVLRWVVDQGYDGSRFLLIDQNQDHWTVGLNYLQEPGMSADWIAGRVVDAITRVFGDEEHESKPVLRNYLPPAIKALALSGWTLAEGRAFMANPVFRRRVLERVRDLDMDVYEFWQEYEQDPLSQKFALLAVKGRLAPFATAEMRGVFGQLNNTIDWSEVLDQGKVVLVNLAPETMSARSQQMLGIVALHQVMSAALRRPQHNRRRFYVYADEFQRLISEEFVLGLEEMRKFGVSCVLAHQHLAQIERAGEWFLQSVIAMPNIRVVFHPGNRADADVLAKELFTGTGEVGGGRVKHRRKRTYYEPVLGEMDVESVRWPRFDGESIPGVSVCSHLLPQ